MRHIVFSLCASTAAAAALGAGVIRDVFGTYTYAWFGGAALCAIAVVLSLAVRGRVTPMRSRPGLA